MAIQEAITAANESYRSTGRARSVIVPSGTFLVDSTNYYLTDGAIYGATSLTLLDGVNLIGTGTIKAAPGSYGAGALYRVISSPDTGISSASISGITIDGNAANQSECLQCSNVLLEVSTKVSISGITSVNANGDGIMLRGRPEALATDLVVSGNTVIHSARIGIQISQFQGIRIESNLVRDSGDNGIDIYGDDGSDRSTSSDFLIANNRVSGSRVGIFPETVRNGVVRDNDIQHSFRAGILVNRINGQPENVEISANSISRSPIGVIVSGDTAGVRVERNVVQGFQTTGVQVGNGKRTVSNVLVSDNMLHPSGRCVPLVTITGSRARSIEIATNYTYATDRTCDALITALVTEDISLLPAAPLPQQVGGKD